MRFNTTRRGMQELSTAALPDIVFILLFFFMTTTAFKDSDIQVQNELPSAIELEAIEGSERVVHLWIGKPLQASTDASALVQIDDAIIPISRLETAILSKISQMPVEMRPAAEVVVKVDKGVKLSVVQEVKEKLASVSVRKVHYIALPK